MASFIVTMQKCSKQVNLFSCRHKYARSVNTYIHTYIHVQGHTYRGTDRQTDRRRHTAYRTVAQSVTRATDLNQRCVVFFCQSYPGSFRFYFILSTFTRDQGKQRYFTQLTHACTCVCMYVCMFTLQNIQY